MMNINIEDLNKIMKLNPTISAEEIADWEKKQSEEVGFKVELPEDFKEFLMTYGNGFIMTVGRGIVGPLDQSYISSENAISFDSNHDTYLDDPITICEIGWMGQGEFAEAIVLSGNFKGKIAEHDDGALLCLNGTRTFEDFIKGIIDYQKMIHTPEYQKWFNETYEDKGDGLFYLRNR